MKKAQSFEKWLRLFVLSCLILYVVFLRKDMRTIRPDHLFLIFLMLTLAFQRSKLVHLFLFDWLPFIIFLMLYDMMRGYAPGLYDRVHVAEPYQWDKYLFGWLFGGEAPPFALHEWGISLDDRAWKRVWDGFFSIFYLIHFVSPMIFMWIIWQHRRDRRMFYRFTYTLTVLNFMALATFILFPAAPPWYYREFGLIQPSATQYGQAAGGLLSIDKHFRIQVFATVWSVFNPNYFAAVPSLHGTWPLAIALFSVLEFGKKLLPILIYPLLVCLAGAYFLHHYFVDYLIGWAYLFIAYGFVHVLLLPGLFDRILNYGLLEEHRRARVAD